MDSYMTEKINERIENIREYLGYRSGDKLATEFIINNSYHIMKSAVDYMKSLPQDSAISKKDFFDIVNILRHVYNISCCTLHIGYSHGDFLVADSLRNQVNCLDGFVNKGEAIPQVVMDTYEDVLSKKANGITSEKTAFVEALFNDIERYFRCSKCLNYDGKLSDIEQKGWTDIVDYFNDSREEGKIFSLRNFKREVANVQKVKDNDKSFDWYATQKQDFGSVFFYVMFD